MYSHGILLLLFGLQIPIPPPAQPQSGVELVGVTSDTPAVRTGMAMEVQIDLHFAEGALLHPSDTLTNLLGAGSMGKGRVEEIPLWEAPSGRDGLRLIYPLLPLRPGVLHLPPLKLRVEMNGVEGEYAWVSVPLEALQILPVIPPDVIDPAPAPPLLLSEGGRWASKRVALVGCLVSLGVGLLAWLLSWLQGWLTGRARKRAPVGARWEDSHSVRVPSAGEVRKRLETLLAEELGSSPEAEIRWEEVVSLYRTLLLATLNDGPRGQTTPEILHSIELEGEGEGNAEGEGDAGRSLARTILEEGDRMRFGGNPVSAARALDTLSWVGRWLEGTRA